jgi:hypothetical protein
LRDAALHPRVRRAAPGARALAAEQAARDRARYTAAQVSDRHRKLIAAGIVVPARITIALDAEGLGGKALDEQVGTWHGNPDGDIDRWEQALAVPSPEQVRMLAVLTGCPEVWFYEPIEPGPLPADGPIWICYTGRGGCTAAKPHIITAGGVLLYEGQPRPPVDTCPAPLPGMPAPQEPAPRKREPAATQAPRKRAASKAAAQPALPTSGVMPAHLRAELAAKLAARNKP